MNIPSEIVREAIEGLEDMLVRFDGKKKTGRTVGAKELFYMQVVLEELGMKAKYSGICNKCGGLMKS